MQNYSENVKSNNLKIRAYRFSLSVLEFSRLISKDRTYHIIMDQLLRAATSVGANIIEAQAASSKKDFTNYYQIALKSANETKYWLCLIRDSYPELKEKAKVLLQEAEEISKMLGSSVLTLKGRKSF